jgi:hypothetical protein
VNHDAADVTNKDLDAAEVNGQRADKRAIEEETPAADKQFAGDTDAHRAAVAEHEKEMMEIGAEVKGEGAVD